MGRDGYIHAATDIGKVLKIDTTNYLHCLVGNKVVSDHKCGDGWGNVGWDIDGCIYLPPYNAGRVLTYDPHTNYLHWWETTLRQKVTNGMENVWDLMGSFIASHSLQLVGFIERLCIVLGEDHGAMHRAAWVHLPTQHWHPSGNKLSLCS